MKFPEKFERYLSVLERHLEGLPASHRISIINQARDEMERKLSAHSEAHPSPSTAGFTPDMVSNEVLKDFIPMEAWLARQLQSRGLKLPERKTSTNSKLFFSLVGLLLLFIISLSFAIWYFSPVIEIDDENGNVSFFGGQFNTADIKEIERHFNQLDWTQTDSLNNQRTLNGVRSFNDVDIREIHIDASTTALVLKTSAYAQLRWSCQTQNQEQNHHARNRQDQRPKNIFSRTDNQGALLDLSAYNKTKCVLELPLGVPVKITATQIKMNSENIAFPLNILASYGQIELSTDANYEFEFSLKNNKGPVDNFANSNHPDRFKIKVELIQGSISKSVQR